MSQPTLAGALQPAWTQHLSTEYFVNSVAISDDGSRVVAGTFYHDYSQGLSASPSAPDARAPGQHPEAPPPAPSGISPNGIFGIYCYDGSGNLLWSDPEEMFEGVYWVAISGNGAVAAAAGWYSDSPNSTSAVQGLLKIYDAVNGAVLLNYTAIMARVNAVALSEDGSVAVAIAGSTIYVFSQQNGVYNPTPATVVLPSGTPQAIAVNPSGQWLAACDNQGRVYLILNSGQTLSTYQWQIPGSDPPTIHSVAIAGGSNYFVAGATNGNVYVFDLASMMSSPAAPVAHLTVSANVSIRWVACSGNAGLITAVYNFQSAGMLAALSFDGQNLTNLWQAKLNQMPNSTSVDALGQYVTAADGYEGAGDFYLFTGASGQSMGYFQTSAMCWPMFLSADGSAVAAGSDDGSVYYFSTGTRGSTLGG